MSKKTANIIIVETSLIIYEGLSKVLTDTSYAFNIHWIDNFSELQQLNLKFKANIILINTTLIQNLIKDFHSLKKEFINTHWVGIVYTFAEPQLLSLFDGIVYINDPSNKILAQIQKLLISEQQTVSQTQQQETLSERETDVLKLLVTGNANKEIADKLNISTNTVISHRKNISQKTGIKSVSGLTIYAVVNNIISIDSYQE